MRATRGSRPGGRTAPVSDPSAIALRRVRASDASTVSRLRGGLLEEMGEVPREAIARYLPGFERWFRRELSAGRLWGFLAVNGGGRPIGSGLVWLQPRVPSPKFRDRFSPYVFSVFIEPEYRGQRLGSQIVSALVASAESRGYVRVELHATEAGRGLYERLGFRPTTQLRLALGAGRSTANTRRHRRRALARAR